MPNGTLDAGLIFCHIVPMTDRQKEIIARSFRMSGAVCFIFLLVTSNKYFDKQPQSLAFWKVLPGPIVASLSISFVLTLAAQIWLKRHRSGV